MSEKLSPHGAFLHMACGSMGGFARALAEAWMMADSINQAKIEGAFPDLLKRAHVQIDAISAMNRSRPSIFQGNIPDADATEPLTTTGVNSNPLADLFGRT